MSSAHLERNLETLFYDSVKRAGGLPYKLVPSHAGLPDRFVIWPAGRVTFVELKQDDGELSPLQREIIRKWALKGTHVTVLYGAKDIKPWVAAQALL